MRVRGRPVQPALSLVGRTPHLGCATPINIPRAESKTQHFGPLLSILTLERILAASKSEAASLHCELGPSEVKHCHSYSKGSIMSSTKCSEA